MVAGWKLLNTSDVCQDDIDDIDSVGPGLKIVVTRRSNVTGLVTLTACKGHDRNVKTIILQRQMGPMTKCVRPNTGTVLSGCCRLCHLHTETGGGGDGEEMTGVIPGPRPWLDVTLMRSLTSGKNNQG